MPALYRKYRPQTFKELIGQNHIKITLQHELERGEISHAYLFCGPRGLGKTTTARLLAKGANCLNRQKNESEPCNKCSSCLDIMANRSIDIIEIDAASHTGIDNVRENIIENARFTPNVSKYKVFIIDEVHMLSTPSFNALLKTLEEPPPHVIFILCTTEIHKLPQTIISRCQRFDFKKVSAENLTKRLEDIIKKEGKKVAPAVIKNIVLNSEGCIRDAESLLTKILTLGDDISEEQAEIILPRSDFGSIISLLEFILEKNATAAVELINKLVNEGVDLQIFTDNLIEFLRKILIIKVNGGSAVAQINLSDFGFELDEASQQSAERLAERFDYSRLIATIELFMEKRQELKSAFILQFPLELAVIQLSEEIVCQSDDDFNENGGDSAGGVSVRDKIRDRLSQFNPRKKNTLEAPMSEVRQEKAKDEVRVDMLSSAHKLKPGNFVDLDKIKGNWLVILEKLLERNYTLSALLKISQPLRCHDNVLEIGVKSRFYQERLEDENNKKTIEEVITEAIKGEVLIKGVIKTNIEPMPVNGDLSENRSEQKPNLPIKIVGSAKDVVQEVMDMF